MQTISLHRTFRGQDQTLTYNIDWDTKTVTETSPDGTWIEKFEARETLTDDVKRWVADAQHTGDWIRD